MEQLNITELKSIIGGDSPAFIIDMGGVPISVDPKYANYIQLDNGKLIAIGAGPV